MELYEVTGAEACGRMQGNGTRVGGIRLCTDRAAQRMPVRQPKKTRGRSCDSSPAAHLRRPPKSTGLGAAKQGVSGPQASDILVPTALLIHRPFHLSTPR
eukprot:351774-Chlamydomonas_euryale.AAC.6